MMTNRHNPTLRKAIVSPAEAATILGISVEMLAALRELEPAHVDGTTGYHLEDLIRFTGRGRAAGGNRG